MSLLGSGSKGRSNNPKFGGNGPAAGMYTQSPDHSTNAEPAVVAQRRNMWGAAKRLSQQLKSNKSSGMQP
jgi:hypothetical protein